MQIPFPVYPACSGIPPAPFFLLQNARLTQQSPLEAAQGFQRVFHRKGQSPPLDLPADQSGEKRQWSFSFCTPDRSHRFCLPQQDSCKYGIFYVRQNDICPPPEKIQWSRQVLLLSRSPSSSPHKRDCLTADLLPSPALPENGRRNWKSAGTDPGQKAASS